MVRLTATPHEAAQAPTTGELSSVADELERVIAEAQPQKAKALHQLLIEELRVNGRAEILPTYRVVTPAVSAMSEKWRCRESNPGPSTLLQGFSGRSLLTPLLGSGDLAGKFTVTSPVA